MFGQAHNSCLKLATMKTEENVDNDDDDDDDGDEKDGWKWKWKIF